MAAPTKDQRYTFALGAFCEAWEAAHRAPYVPSPAECTQLHRLVGRLPGVVADQLPAIFDRYLQDHDPFVAQTQCHSLLWFCSPKSNAVNKYRARTSVMSVKEARTMETLRNWEERTNGNHK